MIRLVIPAYIVDWWRVLRQKLRQARHWVRTRRMVCGWVFEHRNAEVATSRLRMFTRCPDCGFESKGLQLPPTPDLRDSVAGDPKGPKVVVGGAFQQDEHDTRRMMRQMTENVW